jgi:hypothetical protein
VKGAKGGKLPNIMNKCMFWILDDIDVYGAHLNYHTGLLELNHIENIKKMAKMTQRSKSVLDW